MKQFLGSVIICGIAGVLVTSALVVAQVPAPGPAVGVVTGKVQVEAKKPNDAAQKVEATAKAVPAPPVVFGKARIVGRPANLENLVQQYMRQARPLVRAELIFVRKVCELSVEQFRRIHQDTESAFKDVITKFVEAQQQRRVRVVGQAVSPQAQALDGVTVLREGLEAVMKKDLTPEQFSRYRAEVEKRDAFQKQIGIRYLVDAIDRDLYLSDEQRAKLAESLSSHWDSSWKTSLEYLLYANRFFPAGIEPYVVPILDANQKKVWESAQRVAGLGGAFGLLGSFMNDMDALEPELANDKEAGPPAARAKASGALEATPKK